MEVRGAHSPLTWGLNTAQLYVTPGMFKCADFPSALQCSEAPRDGSFIRMDL